jgi:hypothetical protein
METCPFCGAIMQHILESGDTKVPIYRCGTHYDLTSWSRTPICYKTEITALKEGLRKAIGQLERYNFWMPTAETTTMLPALRELVKEG